MSSESPKNRTVDARQLIARGEEPFPRIMAAVAALGPTDRLTVITPFLPSPLIEKLQSEGYEARAERRADGGWQTQFIPSGPR